MGEKVNLPEDCRPILRIADAHLDVDPSVRTELERYYNRLDLMVHCRYIDADGLLSKIYETIERKGFSPEMKQFLTGRAELYSQALFRAGT